jgi:chemotaxis protein methyltransferase CheR
MPLRDRVPEPAARCAAVPNGADLPPLRAAEFEEIRTFAKQRFGLDLRHGKEDLVSARLARAVRQGRFRSYREYLDSVQTDKSGDALTALINALTTNHTSFYREPLHFEFLAGTLLPHMRPASGLRIWSAACSTGEEPYSIACSVAQAWNRQVSGLRILATDISTRVLDAARAATYSKSSLAAAPLPWVSNFFSRAGAPEGMLRVQPDIAAAVRFQRLNLVEPLPFTERFHVIFCRNVMIYFDKPTQEMLVRRLAERLEPEGHLFVGHSESLAGVNHPLTYVRPAVYRRDRTGRKGT